MTTEKALTRKIKASRDLQIKVGTGQIDVAKVEAAQKKMDENDVDFGQLAKPELDSLQKALNAATKKGRDPKEVMESFRTPIMNLKANAGTFNYKFVSQLTGSVLLLLETIDKPDRKVIQIVDVLHKTILLALAYKMKGDGGSSGKALVEAFQEICRKYKPRK